MKRFSENKAARITVQRITVVINRRRNTCAFEGVGAVPAASDMRRKIAGRTVIANSESHGSLGPGAGPGAKFDFGPPSPRFGAAVPKAFGNGGADRNRTCDLLIANETLCQLSYDPIHVRPI